MAIGQVLFVGTCIAVMWGCEQGIGVRDIHLTAERAINARHVRFALEIPRSRVLTNVLLVGHHIPMLLPHFYHLRQV